MATTSFLHAASAKAVADKLRCDLRNDEKSRDAHTEALRLLLVEEENDDVDNDGGTNDFAGAGGSLARSLAMDAAYSLVLRSSLPCRGCREEGEGIAIAAGDRCPRTRVAAATTTTARTTCGCCKVALLVPGKVERPKRKRRRNDTKKSKFVGETGKVAFPLSCSRHGTNDDAKEAWDPTLLGQIQIKYVHSLEDAVRYLAYAPSLPEHMQPLDGIFLLGLGELVPRHNNNDMEFAHVLSFLSDTVNILEDNRRHLLKSSGGAQSASDAAIPAIATVDKLTYESIPRKVVRHHGHWMDFIASIVRARGDAVTSVREDWNLVFENAGILEPEAKASSRRQEEEIAFGFSVRLDVDESDDCTRGSTHQISWKI